MQTVSELPIKDLPFEPILRDTRCMKSTSNLFAENLPLLFEFVLSGMGYGIAIYTYL